MFCTRITGEPFKVNIQKKSEVLPVWGQFTRYTVKDGRIPVGRVDLRDTDNGVYVLFVEKTNQNYKHFGHLADAIEVNHCMNRGLDTFEIKSDAALNSHVQHYKRGKRFEDNKVNEFIRRLIKTSQKSEKFNTTFLGRVKMFMPPKLIKKYVEILKKNPIL